MTRSALQRAAADEPQSEQQVHVAAAEQLARELAERYRDATARDLIAAMVHDVFQGRIALQSSFGAEASVLLHLVADVAPSTPVIFLNTGKLFGETLRYRDALVERLGLTDVRSIAPEPERVESLDPDGVLWYGNPDMCCFIRKVEPLQRALAGFDAYFTGRKVFHGGERATLARVEAKDDGRIAVNPLADWPLAEVDAYITAHELPRHPLQEQGFLSIGCMPCTDRVQPGEDVRAGRWRNQEKTECGIHDSSARWRFMGIDSP
jgi:phosphoadenosine phosphosulfate reductase